MLRLIQPCFSGLIGVLAVLGVLRGTTAQSGTPLSAEASDPVKLGWMTGFPPPPDKLIMQPESDFFSFPKLRWTVCHIRELMPTKQVSRGIAAPAPLAYPTAGNAQIDPTSLPAYQAVAEYLIGMEAADR